MLAATAAWSLGRWLLGRWALPAAVTFAAGAAMLSTLIFVLLAAALARPPGLITLGLLCLAPAWIAKRPRSAWTLPPRWCWIPLLAYGVLYGIHALAPEIQTDALNYHLMIPVEAQRSGRFPAAVSFYNVLPQGVETLFALAFAVGGDSAAKLLHLVFLGATIGLLGWLSTELAGDPRAGWSAGLFYALTPVVGMSATCAFNDAALAYVMLATSALLGLWWKQQQPRLLFAAGICAGFCYAIKMTGGLAVATALVAVFLRARGWRPVLFFLLGAGAASGPWIARAYLLTGNPFAPLLNQLFPNPYFHLESEKALGAYLRHYGGIEWSSIGQELTLYGDQLQGVVGPLWLLSPLLLLGLRHRPVRLLFTLGAISLTPWFLNVGARFLMPALVFFSLAWMLVMPERLRVALVLGQALLSWPPILERYTHPNNWALIGEQPWGVALGLEPRESYLKRRSDDWNVAQMVRAHTTEADQVLDLIGAPAAITARNLISAWQTARGEILVKVLETGAIPDQGWMIEWSSQFDEVEVDAVRLRFQSSQQTSTGLYEIRLLGAGGTPLKPDSLWSIESKPNPWESPLAIDGSLVTAWWTWEPVKAGMYYQLELPARERISEIRVIGHRSAASLAISLEARAEDWRPLPVGPPWRRPGLNLRRPAISFLQRQQVTHILAASGHDGFGRLSSDLIRQQKEWGLKAVAEDRGVVLLKLVP